MSGCEIRPPQSTWKPFMKPHPPHRSHQDVKDPLERLHESRD